MDSLTHDERMQLMRFVCAFAWADLAVAPEERSLVEALIVRLGLEKDRTVILSLLDRSPAPEKVDPLDVPTAHRDLFLMAAREVFLADGRWTDKEREQFELLEQLLG